MTQGVRVFKETIGNWPKVYFQRPGSYVIVARHRSPSAERWAWVLAVVAGWFVGIQIFQSSDAAGRDVMWAALWAVLGGGFCFRILLEVLKAVPILSSGTRIAFDGGEITWKSASGRGSIPQGEPRQFRHDAHREAGAEARRNAKAQRQGIDGTTIYQTTSEVLIDTGPGWMHPHLIAEISKDEVRHKAHKLAMAMAFVDENARAERIAWEIQMSQPGALIGGTALAVGANELD